jgi:tellurite resistance protein
MAIPEAEANACMKVLVALAKADGRVHSDELRSLTAALSGLEVEPSSLSVLLEEQVDVEAELAKIVSPEGRAQTYRSAYFLAYADGECSASEQAILETIAGVTTPSEQERNSLDRVFATAPKKSRYETLLEAVGGLFRRKG